MMRLTFWRNDTDRDALDPDVRSIFAAGSHGPTLDAARFERGRVMVAAKLRSEPASGSWFSRRLGYGILGGGGLWASMVGAAAANKAATAVAVGALLAGGATAEVTGIGPAVREAVSPIHSGSEPAVPPSTTPTAEDQASRQGAASEDAPPSDENGAAVTVSESPEDVPGNLTSQLRPDGAFSLRGVLIAVEGDVIEVQTNLDDVPLQFEFGDAIVRLPGPAQSQTLEDFEGYLVRVAGHCATVDGQLTEDCTVDTINVLGTAGQNGGPDANDGDTNNGAGANASPQQPGNGQGNGQGGGPPDEPGRPDDPGKPDDTPGNGPGGNGNAKPGD